MEDKKIIIILLVIIVILVAALGIMLLSPANAKEPTKVRITSNKTLYEGDSIVVQLTDLNKTPLTKEKLNIKIANSKGKLIVNKTIKTNSKGKAKLDWDLKKGKYEVNVTYAGNENYTGNNTTQKLTIKEEEIVEATLTSSSSSTYYNGIDLSGGSGESVVINSVSENGIIDGYKGGRKGIWTPSGNFIEEGGGY